jgi:hypothetical protein
MKKSPLSPGLSTLLSLLHAAKLLYDARRIRFTTCEVGKLGHLCLMRYRGDEQDRAGSSFDMSCYRGLLRAHSETVERQVVRPLLAANTNNAVASAAHYREEEAECKAVAELYERDAIVNSWAAKGTDGLIPSPPEFGDLISVHGVGAEFFRLRAISGFTVLCMLTEQDTGAAVFGSAHVMYQDAASTAAGLHHALYEALMMFFGCKLDRGATTSRDNVCCGACDFTWLKNSLDIAGGSLPREKLLPGSHISTNSEKVRKGIHIIFILKSPDVSGLMSNRHIRLAKPAFQRLYPTSDIDTSGAIPVLSLGADRTLKIE